MTDEVTRWYRLSALLPEPEATRVRDCWDTGEQEAGLDTLVSALLAHRVVISENRLVEIAVLAQEWGMGGALTARLLYCAAVGSDEENPPLRLIEHPDARPLPSPGSDHVLVPWIGCGRCGGVLARAHTVEPWGDLSFLPLHYTLMGPRPAPPRVFGAHSPWPALEALRTDCAPARMCTPSPAPAAEPRAGR
ncbi:hypothetical protein [Streptomyces sp. NPDC000229]|uniref:hypothetical protein n=1 Tax=Streptomyces sp. NPDC000229 TaxID=3154247 RepID=UPI00332FDE63